MQDASPLEGKRRLQLASAAPTPANTDRLTILPATISCEILAYLYSAFAARQTACFRSSLDFALVRSRSCVAGELIAHLSALHAQLRHSWGIGRGVLSHWGH